MNLFFVSDFLLGIIAILRMLLFTVFTIAGAFMLSSLIGPLLTTALMAGFIGTIALTEAPVMIGQKVEEEDKE